MQPPCAEFSAQVCGWGLGDPTGHHPRDGDLTPCSAQAAWPKGPILFPVVPRHSHFCIQRSLARHITGTAWTTVQHRGGGSRERAQGDSGHGEDAARSPCTPRRWQPSQTTPCHPVPAPGRFPAPLHPRDHRGGSPPATSACPVPCHPPCAGAVKPFRGAHWHSSWGRSPMAPSDPTHLPGLATAHGAERHLSCSSPPV